MDAAVRGDVDADGAGADCVAGSHAVGVVLVAGGVDGDEVGFLVGRRLGAAAEAHVVEDGSAIGGCVASERRVRSAVANPQKLRRGASFLGGETLYILTLLPYG